MVQGADDAARGPAATSRVRGSSALETIADIQDALGVPRDTPLDELPHLVALRCRPIPRVHLLDLVLGSLQQSIQGHGSIDQDGVVRAATRVTDAVLAVLRALHTQDVDQAATDPGTDTADPEVA